MSVVLGCGYIYQVKAYKEVTKESKVFLVKVNENRQTYGSNLSIEEYTMDKNGNPSNLDLILVEAENGEVGYVMKEDFYDTKNQPKNPQEAVAYMENLRKQGDKVVPVYKDDGETIIGTYRISTD